MVDDDDKSTMPDSRQESGQARSSRDERLKSALRENLKRRKLQARERAASAEPSQNENDSLAKGAAGKSGGSNLE